MGIKSSITNNLKNIIGKSVKYKYVIIESDDWGSIRMPSVKAYHNLAKKNVNLVSGDADRYNRTDTLAGPEDFEALYDVLRKFRDTDGNHPVFTAMSVVANPNFDKIKEENFEKYFYEPFPLTLERYNKSAAIKYWKEGIEMRLFVPEFHGREHLNVSVWMRALQNGDESTHAAFMEGCWGFRTNNRFNINYQAAFDLEYEEDLVYQKEVLDTGLDLFKKIHGYSASVFVPPNGPFNRQLEKVVKVKGVKYIGAAKVQKEPKGQGKIKKHYHWLGKKNNVGLIYLTRNAFFEPNAGGKDWVSSCLNDIDYAFKWNKPAVISSHRTNYIGSLDSKNRKESLVQLKTLLETVLKKWPDVRFITTGQLGNILKD